MNVFKLFSQNIIKWWYVRVAPIFHINNNTMGPHRFESDEEWKKRQEEEKRQEEKRAALSDTHEDQEDESNATIHEAEKASSDSTADAMAILDRINHEKNDARTLEIEKQRKLREEQDRIASIMNTNKVDISSFIEEGRNLADTNSNGSEDSSSDSGSGSSKSDEMDEQMRRAQEILDRLNREAAEDEAKKAAEIEAAKKAAGVL